MRYDNTTVFPGNGLLFWSVRMPIMLTSFPRFSEDGVFISVRLEGGRILMESILNDVQPAGPEKGTQSQGGWPNAINSGRRFDWACPITDPFKVAV
jgi:hypothetical protein